MGVAKMTDVAARAGVSSATVSRVLNNSPTVDPGLATRVREAAAQLGYQTNGLARSLRRRRADVWALIISDISNPFFTSVARGVEDVAQGAGYSVVLCNTDEDPAKEAQYLDVAAREQFSGVILSPNLVGSDVSRLHQIGIQVVAIDRPLRDQVDSVLTQSREGACVATTHLLEQGWTRPACVTGPRRSNTAQQRLTGYGDALSRRGLPVSETLIRHTDYRADTARVAVAELLDQDQPPDSLFVANSSLGLGALEELAHRGLKTGRDIGLIMVDDPPWAALVEPPLTVMRQPAYQMGRDAAELLLQRISYRDGRKPPAETIVLAMTLVTRASSLRTQ